MTPELGNAEELETGTQSDGIGGHNGQGDRLGTHTDGGCLEGWILVPPGGFRDMKL